MGWMVSRDLQDLWELRGGRGSKASRAMQDLVELRVSAVLAGREGNVGQQGCQGGPGSRERRGMLVMLESWVSRDRRDEREMLAPRALLECRDWELHRGRLERKAAKERRARRGCWASLVSAVLQDPPEPGDALVGQVCEALPGSMVLKE